jgi:hypothetical protein
MPDARNDRTDIAADAMDSPMLSMMRGKRGGTNDA